MGCCFCLRRTAAAPTNDLPEGAAAVAVGRNQPLKPDKPKWKSDHPMTEEQLRSQRDQFWDTSPAFEGHKEIWDALKAAAYALESGDHLLAQAIVDSANIMLPTGSLEDCYDELGSRYQLPVYVLSAPINLQLDSSDIDEPPEKLSPSSKKRKRGSELPIRLQLSTGPVMRLTMRTNDSVLSVRQHVAAMTDVGVGRVRLFFAGKQLTDHTRLKDAGLRKSYTIQAVLSEAGLSETSGKVDSDVAEMPSFSDEPHSERTHTVPAVTEVVAPEQVVVSATDSPVAGFIENSEQIQMSAECVTSAGSALSTECTGTSLAVESNADLEVLPVVSSAVTKDVDGSCSGLDTPV